MSKQRQFNPGSGPRSRSARRTRRLTTTIVMLVAAALAAGFWWRNQLGVSAQGGPGIERLAGHWFRPDGGYVIDIKQVDKDGRMDVSYFNPKSIHVARAQASRVGGSVKAVLELRDQNYPGSRYDFAYDPALDSLSGVYYQAALQQNFPVTFVRMK